MIEVFDYELKNGEIKFSMKIDGNSHFITLNEEVTKELYENIKMELEVPEIRVALAKRGISDVTEDELDIAYSYYDDRRNEMVEALHNQILDLSIHDFEEDILENEYGEFEDEI